MKIIIIILSLFIIFTRPAQAYLDPGTGSYLIQILVGGALGGGYLLKTYWHTLKNFFHKKPSIKKVETESGNDDR